MNLILNETRTDPFMNVRTTARVEPFVDFGQCWAVHGLSRLEIGAPLARKPNRRHGGPQRRMDSPNGAEEVFNTWNTFMKLAT